MTRSSWRRVFQRRPAEPQTGGVRSEAQPGSPPNIEPGVPSRDEVRGERAAFILGGPRSLQSRMTSVLAAGLMISVGTGMLAWYYVEALSHPAAGRTLVHTALPDAAGEGMTLPPFGSAAAPRPPGSVAVLSAPATPTVTAPDSSAREQPSAAPALPLAPLLEPSLNRAPGGLPSGYRAPSQPSSPQQALDRRLSGEVFAAGAGRTSSSVAASGADQESSAAAPLGSARAQILAGPGGDALATLLRPSVLSATSAQILPTQRLLLPKGTFIDCTLETAIDSTLPGMTTCVTATDTFGADGAVVLLERGTRLIGETRGEVRQGEARVFVVWTEARTPAGVVVQLDSPGTDALGRSGLEGEVNRHFWQRFGAAALVSTIDGAVQSEVQSSSRGGTVVLDPTASEDVLTEILRATVNIPPTIRVHNGARIQILVARDVDFRPVYELEPR